MCLEVHLITCKLGFDTVTKCPVESGRKLCIYDVRTRIKVILFSAGAKLCTRLTHLWGNNILFAMTTLNVSEKKAKSIITYILSLKTSFSSESIASHFSLKSNERIIRQFTLKQLSSSENRYIIYYGAFTTTTVSRTKMPRETKWPTTAEGHPNSSTRLLSLRLLLNVCPSILVLILLT